MLLTDNQFEELVVGRVQADKSLALTKILKMVLVSGMHYARHKIESHYSIIMNEMINM